MHGPQEKQKNKERKNKTQDIRYDANLDIMYRHYMMLEYA